MDKFKSFEQTIVGEKYLTNLKDYGLNGEEMIVYTGEYIIPQDLKAIQASTSKNLLDTLKDFSIEVFRKENEKAIYASPLAIRKIQRSSIINLAKGFTNGVSLYHIMPKRYIFEYLENLEKGNFPVSRDKIYTFYREIEQIIDIDLSKDIAKDPSNKEHRIHKDGYIYNPLITRQVEKIKDLFDIFVDSLTQEEKSSVLKNERWGGNSYILGLVSDSLYDIYHTDDINYLSHRNAVKNIDEIFLKINKVLTDTMNDKESSDYIVAILKTNITDYIGSLVARPKDKKAYSDIDDYIFENIMAPFYEEIGDDNIVKILDDDIENLMSNLELLLDTKVYSTVSSTGTLNKESNLLSALDLFIKISTYYESGDDDNLLDSIKTLKQYDDKEISNLLSLKNLENLEDILSIDEIAEYEFAARIRDLIKK